MKFGALLSHLGMHYVEILTNQNSCERLFQKPLDFPIHRVFQQTMKKCYFTLDTNLVFCPKSIEYYIGVLYYG